MVIETIPVTADNVKDTIIADEVYPVDEICAGQYARRARRRASARPAPEYPEARGEVRQ